MRSRRPDPSPLAPVPDPPAGVPGGDVGEHWPARAVAHEPAQVLHDLPAEDRYSRSTVLGHAHDCLTAREVEVYATQVKDAAVLPVPDEIHGEEVKAYVLLNDGAAERDLPPEDIVRFCAERLAGFKVPRFIEYRTGDFPRTPSTRVQKQELKGEKPDLREGAWDRDAVMGRPRR